MDTPDKTRLDGPAVRSASDEIEKLADDVNSFPELNEIQPRSGDFAVGHWLDDLVTQRRDALQRHCDELQTTLREISGKLRTLATDIEHVDQANAAQVKKLNDEVETTMGQVRERLAGGGQPSRQA